MNTASTQLMRSAHKRLVSNLQLFYSGHYFITGMRQTAGILLVFAVAYVATSITTASIAAFGATYVAMIDRPGPVWGRVKEMLIGALLGLVGVSLTGLSLIHPAVLLVTMTALAFLFSMMSAYGPHGATIGLACMILSIITLPSMLVPDKVLMHSVISVTGAVAYILYSVVAGYFLRLREAQQCLSVAILGCANYVAARARMYRPNVDIAAGYRELISNQAQMVGLFSGAWASAIEGMSLQALKRSAKRQMIWNVLADLVTLVDHLISTQTAYQVLHAKLTGSPAMDHIRQALETMSEELQAIAVAVSRRSPFHGDISQASAKAVTDLGKAIDELKDRGFDQAQPEAFLLCVQIHQRLCLMLVHIERMATQTQRRKQADVLYTEFLQQPFDRFVPAQSFNPKIFTSNLRLDSAPFRFALRISLATALGMLAGMFVPDTGAHGYWIVLTVFVIMKPAFSLTKRRNTERLIGTVIGCLLTFCLLQLTTQPEILLTTFVIALLLSFVFLVLTRYLIYSTCICVTVLLMLHGLVPHAVNLPLERGLDTLIGSIIALACSFVLPWWEAKSLPSLAQATLRANAALLRTSARMLIEPQPDLPAWREARQTMQAAFSNFAMAFDRMMKEPASKQVSPDGYNHLLVMAHTMSAETVNLVRLARAESVIANDISHVMTDCANAVESFDTKMFSATTGSDTEHAMQSAVLTGWTYSAAQLKSSTDETLAAARAVGMARISQ